MLTKLGRPSAAPSLSGFRICLALILALFCGSRPAAASPALNSLSVSPAAVVGGHVATGSVALSSPAALGGFVVYLGSSNPSAAAVPSTLTLPAGASSATFLVQTQPVSSNPNVMPPGVSVTITARGAISLAAGGKLAALTAALQVAPPTVKALGVTSTPQYGGLQDFGIVQLTGKAPAGGAVVALTSSNPGAVSVPATITVAAGSDLGGVPITTYGVTGVTAVTLTAQRAWYDAKTAVYTLLPPVLWELTVNPASGTGGYASTGRLLLHGRVAPGHQLSVSLVSTNPGTASVPPSVTLAGGSYIATFPIQTHPVAADTTVTVKASYNGATVAGTLTAHPPLLSSLHLNPDAVTGGAASVGTVALNGKAASGGCTIHLWSSSAAAAVPDHVVVPAGASSAQFPIQTQKVTGEADVMIRAAFGVEKTATLRVYPPPQPDLYIYSVTFTDTNDEPIQAPVAGQPCRIYLNVVNGGSGPAGASTLHAAIRGSGGVYSQDEDRDVPALNPGTGATVEIDVPGLSADHFYDFNFYADYGNAVSEFREDNNYSYYGFGL